MTGKLYPFGSPLPMVPNNCLWTCRIFFDLSIFTADFFCNLRDLSWNKMGDNFIARKVQLVVLLSVLGGAHSQTVNSPTVNSPTVNSPTANSQTCTSGQCVLEELLLPSTISSSPDNACFDLNERVNFTCPQGYDLAGPPYNECQDGGSWRFNSSSPFCEDVTPCVPFLIENGMSSPVPNMDISDGVYNPFETIEYSCNAGYVIEGNPRAMCQLGGQWHPDTEPKCVVTCGEYPEGSNGKYTLEPDNFTVDANVEFECYEGYSTSDTLLLTCQSDGTWSEDGPRCEDIDECSEGSHDCTEDDEVCVNTMGSFVCECDTGYSRNADGVCIDDVSLECGPDNFKVTINLARIAGVNVSSIALMGDQDCRAKQINIDTVVIESNLDGCGTSVSVTEDYVEYINIVMDADDADISAPDKILIPVTCLYSKLGNVNPRSFVNDFKIARPLSRIGAARFDFLVYHDDRFLLPLLEERRLLDFTRPIYLEIKAEYVGDVRAGVEQCWATGEDGQNRVQLITDNCPTDDGLVTIVDADNPASFRFTISSALSEESGVTEGLIHCDAIACDPNNDESICSSTCGSLNRRKRSLSGFLHATRLSTV